MLTWGEGWHNNHHAHPQSAKHGLAWYEIDLNWIGISALRMLGLAWDIKLPKIKQEEIAPEAVVVPDLVAASGD
jgi:stearoyl-CoA desaturase (delta-9 desaturase)